MSLTFLEDPLFFLIFVFNAKLPADWVQQCVLLILDTKGKSDHFHQESKDGSTETSRKPSRYENVFVSTSQWETGPQLNAVKKPQAK